MKSIPLPVYLIGAVIIFFVWKSYYGGVKPGTVFGRVPGTNLPGLFVVNADIATAGGQAVGTAERVPGGVRYMSGVDSPAGSR